MLLRYLSSLRTLKTRLETLFNVKNSLVIVQFDLYNDNKAIKLFQAFHKIMILRKTEKITRISVVETTFLTRMSDIWKTGDQKSFYVSSLLTVNLTD